MLHECRPNKHLLDHSLGSNSPLIYSVRSEWRNEHPVCRFPCQTRSLPQQPTTTKNKSISATLTTTLKSTGNLYVNLVFNPLHVNAASFGSAQACVVAGWPNTALLQLLCYFLRVLLRQAVHDSCKIITVAHACERTASPKSFHLWRQCKPDWFLNLVFIIFAVSSTHSNKDGGFRCTYMNTTMWRGATQEWRELFDILRLTS